MKWKLWRSYLSVSAPRMMIRSQMPWPIRLVRAALLLFAGAMLMWGVQNRQLFQGEVPINLQAALDTAHEQVQRLTVERDQFSATVNAAESQLNIERAAQNQLVAQVRTLEKENQRLKEDLAFFESLLPAAMGPQGISIRRLKIEQIAPNQIRYRLLIVQGGGLERDFQGSLQLSVSTLQEGKSAMINFPDSSPAEREKFQLSFRHYQRVEGVLALPEGAVAKLIQARVLERGQVRAQASTNL